MTAHTPAPLEIRPINVVAVIAVGRCVDDWVGGDVRVVFHQYVSKFIIQHFLAVAMELGIQLGTEHVPAIGPYTKEAIAALLPRN